MCYIYIVIFIHMWVCGCVCVCEGVGVWGCVRVWVLMWYLKGNSQYICRICDLFAKSYINPNLYQDDQYLHFADPYFEIVDDAEHVLHLVSGYVVILPLFTMRPIAMFDGHI